MNSPIPNPASSNLDQWPWYHGVLCRERAEELLRGSQNGVYLIRDSSTYNGEFTLSMTYQNKFRHYRIRWVTTANNPNRTLTIDNKRFYNNLIELIDGYSSRFQRALCTKLVQCLPKRSSSEGNNYVVVQYPSQQQIENRERMPTPPLELATDSLNFNDFIVEELKALNKRVEDLAREQDRLEMWGRRKILLFHGVSERGCNNVHEAVIKIIKNTLKLPISSADITRCHRLGQSNNSNSIKPILVKLKDIKTRNTVWYSKVRLEGAGITLSEFLTKERYKALQEARKRFGVTNCWTKDGCVVFIAEDGSQHRVTSVSELDNIPSRLETIYNQILNN